MANTKLPARLLDTSAIPALNVTGDLTVDTTTLKVDSTNNRVGIGIASPKTTLNVAANNSGQGPILTLENTDTSITTGDVIGQIDFYANDGSSNGTGPKVNIKAVADSGAGSKTELTFGTSPSSSATAIERMRIDASGKVGIGTTNPGQTLEIHNSDASDYTDFGLQGTGHKYVIGVGNDSVSTVNDKLYIYDNDNTAFRMVVDTSGKVGIGTASPSKSLSVKAPSGSNGGIDVFHNNGNKVAELVHSGSGDEGRLSLLDSGSTTVQFMGETGQNSYINSGNVGIGTTNPSAKLEVIHGNVSQGNGVSFGRNASQSWDFWADSGANVLYSKGNFAIIGTSDSQDLSLRTNNLDRIRIASSGAVTFNNPIQIASSSNAEISITGSASGNLVASNDLYIMAGSGTSSGNLYLGSDGGNAQVILDGGQLTTQGITAVSTGNYSTGNVGLIAKSVSSRGTVRIRSDADNAAELFFDVNGAIRWDLSSRQSSANYDLLFYPQHGTPVLDAVGSHKFRFTQTGHLGIGTSTNARSGLDVDGAVTSSNSDNDLLTHSHSSYASRVGSGRIDVTAGYSGTLASGRQFKFKYNAVSWKAYHGRITLSGTGGFASYEFGGYWNNSGGSQTEQMHDALQSSCAISTSGQALIITITIGQTVVHPCFSVEYNQSGGDGAPRMDRAEFFIQ